MNTMVSVFPYMDLLEITILVSKKEKLIMPSKITSNARPPARKTRKRRTSDGGKEERSSLLNSLHQWGEDYYGAEDYYEKSVNSIPKRHSYHDYQKKANKP
ncbi:MAG: hypothetical protein GQ553_03155 [Nitrosomonadaceae bacterium]|nr:hypothetical protein [Nitrosomonadaceae bacterium]